MVLDLSSYIMFQRRSPIYVSTVAKIILLKE